MKALTLLSISSQDLRTVLFIDEGDRRANFSAMAAPRARRRFRTARHVRQRGKRGAPNFLGDAALVGALKAATQRRLRPALRGPKPKERG
ncbi:MAG: hypothetical protein ABR863_04420 [Roseiarcus sp.]